MSEEEKSIKEQMDELCKLTEQGAKAGYILAPQLDVMKEQAEKRGAERMLEAAKICFNNTKLLFVISHEDVWAEYERLKEQK